MSVVGFEVKAKSPEHLGWDVCVTLHISLILEPTSLIALAG